MTRPTRGGFIFPSAHSVLFNTSFHCHNTPARTALESQTNCIENRSQASSTNRTCTIRTSSILPALAAAQAVLSLLPQRAMARRSFVQIGVASASE